MYKAMKKGFFFWLTLGLGFLFFASAQASIPLSIRTSNLDGTDGTAVISFMTVDAVRVTAHYGIGNTGNVQADTLSTGNVHYISLTGLSAGSSYQFAIESNGIFYNNNGSNWTFVIPSNITKNATDVAVIPLVSVRNLASALVTPSVVYVTAYSLGSTSNTRSFLYIGSGSTFGALDFMNVNGLSRFGNFSAGATTYRYEVQAGFPGVTNNVRTFANFVPTDAINPATVIPSPIGPSVFNRNPAAGSTNVVVSSLVAFSLVDNDYLVSANSVRVTVNGILYQPGGPGYSAVQSGITLNVTINPTVSFVTNQTVTVNIFAQDSTGNIGTNTYTFNTELGDITPPVITALTPAASSTNVALNTNVSMNINDVSSGVSLNTIRVTVNGTLVVDNGVAVGGSFPATVITSGLGFNININPNSDFTSNSVVTVNVSARDVSGNLASTTYIFTTTPGDITPPTVTAITPTSGSINVAINTDVSMNITDGTGVSLNTVQVTINGTASVVNGAPAGGAFPATVVASGLGFNININPTVDFANSTLITLLVSARDISGNVTSTSYSFTTIAAGPVDTTPPTTNAHSPARAATGVSANGSIVVHVVDAGVGVSQNSIVMMVSGNTVSPIITGTAADYTLTYAYTGYTAGATINVSIAARDVSNNMMVTDNYSFVIYSAPVSSNWLAPYPISVPTIFDPSVGQTTTLIWPLAQTSEIVIKIYDMNGQSILQRRFLSGSNGATAGINNTYVWDGKDDMGRLQASGIYFYYVLAANGSQQSFIGRGNIIIRRTR